MSWRRTVGVVLVAVATATAGCGGGGGPAGLQEPPHEEFKHLGGLNLVTQHAEWAIVVCRDVAGWLDAVNAAAAPLPREAGAADRAALRATLQRALAEMTGRTDRLVTHIRSYGDPHVPGGAAAAATFRQALVGAQATMAQGREAAAGAPVEDPAAFQSALDQAQAAVDQSARTVRTAYAQLEKYGPGDLRRMFGQRDECTPIFQDSPTGPIPVPPHVR